MKKFVAVIVSICCLLCISPVAFATAPLNYVVLGDSIAAGSGVYNSEEACYGKIVADTNGYEYSNFAVAGYRSEDLLNITLARDDVKKALKKADIVSISIGGNDFLQQDLPKLIALAAIGDYHHLENIEANLYTNIDKIITAIRKLNPDCVILMQTLYNTHTGLMEDIYDLAIPRVNDAVISYYNNNPGAYEIVDVETAFEGHPEYVAVDTIHPTAVGNVVLAQCVLDKISELGLGEETEPTVNTTGIDEIPYTSYILSFFLNLFRNFFNIFNISV